jgi:hypothetical protein
MPIITVGFRNDGRAAAEIIEVCIVTVVAPQLTDKPDYGKRL